MMKTRREASRSSGEADQLVAEIEVCELWDKDRRPRVLARCGPIGAAPARPDSRLPAPGPTSHALGRHPPRPGPAGRPGQQLLGLEPRRRRRAPNGRAGSRRAGSRASSPPRHRSGWEPARPLPPLRPGHAPSRHLPGPTPSQRPPVLGPSAEAAQPPVRGLKWLRNKENLGSGERRSDWPGGGARRGNLRRRSPWQRRRGWENRGLGLRARVGRRTTAVSRAGPEVAASAPRPSPRLPRGPAGPAWGSVAARPVSVMSRCRGLPGGDVPRPHLCPPL